MQQGLGNGVVCFSHVLCTVWRGTERGRVRAYFGYLIQSIILEVASVAADFGKFFLLLFLITFSKSGGKSGMKYISICFIYVMQCHWWWQPAGNAGNLLTKYTRRAPSIR